MTEGGHASLAESSRAEYLYTRQCKRTLRPRLTWQCELDWWGRVSRRGDSAQRGAAAAVEATRTLSRKATDSAANTAVAAAATTILGLTPQPRRPRCRRARIALLLSTGQRFLLPLLPAVPSSTSPQTHAACGTCYWSTATRLTEAGVGTASAVDVRLVLGSLDAIATLAGVLTHSTTCPGKSACLNLDLAQEGDAHDVLQYTFVSVPYKVLWLSAVSDRLLVSLPCEERIGTFVTQLNAHGTSSETTAVPPSSQPHECGSAGRAGEQGGAGECTDGACLHSFSLPRGVVPLDMAEVGDGDFVAVGTVEHGVLLCGVEVGGGMRGAVRAVCRAVGLSGLGAALFPVTRLVALFPRRSRTGRRRSSLLRWPTNKHIDDNEDHVRPADAVSQLWHGALICSCPYEVQSVLIKLSDGAEGVIEDMSGAGGPEAVLHVGSSVEANASLLLCTTAHRILELRAVPPHSHTCEAADDDDEDDDGNAAAEHGSTTKQTRFDRVVPTVVQRRLLRLEQPVLRVLDGEPVYQGKTYSNNYVPSYKFTKHWTLCVDANNDVHLLDRSPTLYAVHSSYRLVAITPSVAEDGTSAAAAVVSAVSGKSDRRRRGGTTRRRASARDLSSSSSMESDDGPRVVRGGKRGRNEHQGNAARDGEPRKGCAKVTEGRSDALDNLATGLAFLDAGDGWLRAVVTHHRNRISVVTWQGSNSS